MKSDLNQVRWIDLPALTGGRDTLTAIASRCFQLYRGLLACTLIIR
jgi:hypothetical protein